MGKDREAASAIRDSASWSEMKVSEKMTSYLDLVSKQMVVLFGRPHLWVCEQIVSDAENMRATIC